MKTTLTLEPDVAEQIQREVRRTGKAMKAVVNDALRSGLSIAPRSGKPPRFEVRPHSFGFKPGIDLDRMNQLADALVNEGLVDWLLACPEKNFFVPVESESTAEL